MLYKMLSPSTIKVGDRVIVFAGKVHGEGGTITHIVPQGYGVITRFHVFLDAGNEIACSLSEIYDPTPELDPAAELDQLREINADLLAACEQWITEAEAVSSMTGFTFAEGSAAWKAHAAIAKARKGS